MTDPTHDLPAERATLAALLIEPHHIGTVSQVLCEDDFSAHDHRGLWVCLVAVAPFVTHGHPVDAHMVDAEATRRKIKNTINATDLMRDLCAEHVSSAHIETWAKGLAEIGQRRRMATATRHAGMVLADPARAAHEAVTLAGSLISAAVVTSHRGAVAMGAAVVGAMDLVMDACARGTPAIPTGFRCLDGDERVAPLLGGMHRGRLMILAATQGGGKTSLAMQFARSAASVGRALVFSQEMRPSELALRMACGDAGVSFVSVITGRMTGDETTALMSAANDVARVNLDVVHEPGITADRIYSAGVAASMRGDLALIVVDYLGLLGCPEGFRRDNIEGCTSHATQMMKRLAGAANVPVLLLAQFNRAASHRGSRPTLHDLKGSGAIESDADVVMILHEDELWVDKNRLGRIDKVPMIFDRPRTRFNEAPTVGAQPESAYDDGRGDFPDDYEPSPREAEGYHGPRLVKGGEA